MTNASGNVCPVSDNRLVTDRGAKGLPRRALTAGNKNERHQRYACRSGQPLERQIPVFIQRLVDRVRGPSEMVPGSEDGKAAKSAGLLTSHWTSAVTICTK